MRKRLVLDIFVEPYCPERVARQFGCAQVFPLPRLQLDGSHGEISLYSHFFLMLVQLYSLLIVL
jgi:hypothetical protein